MMEQLPSIDGLLQIALGGGIMGAALAYAWWSSIRVTFFRQDLFVIRDRMWDRAREAGALEDPKYQYMREVLNSCISAASFISLPQMVRARLVGQSEGQVMAYTARPDVELIVADAENAMVSRVTRYVLLDRPVSGVFFGCVLIIAALAVVAPRTFIRELVRSWASTINPHELSSAARRNDRAAHAA